MKHRRTLDDYRSLLEHHFPLRHPVRVCVGRTKLDKSRTPFLRESGRTSLGPAGYYILINSEDTSSAQTDSLIHEWCHCRMPWNTAIHHTDEWGIEFARIWRKIVTEGL